jgi:hypothetical protein
MAGQITTLLIAVDGDDAPQIGAGLAWASASQLDYDVNFVGASVTLAGGQQTKELVTYLDGAVPPLFDPKRYTCDRLELNTYAFVVGTEFEGTLTVRLGTWSGSAFTAVASIEVDPAFVTVDDLGGIVAKTPVELGLSDVAIGSLTHATVKGTSLTFVGDLVLDLIELRFMVAPRMDWVPSPSDVIFRPDAIMPFVRRSWVDQSGRCLIMFVGDSTTIHRGFGWEFGVQEGLQANGVPKFATGVASQGDSNTPPLNSACGTGEQFGTVTCQDYITGLLPAWERASRTRATTRQRVSYSGSAGAFRLKYTGYQIGTSFVSADVNTTDLASNCSASTMAAAVQTAVGSGLVRGTGGPLGTAPIELEFYGVMSPNLVNVLQVVAPVSGTPVTPAVVNVEFWTGNGQPVVYPTGGAAGALNAGFQLMPRGVGTYARQSQEDFVGPLHMDTSGQLVIHHWFMAPAGASLRAGVRKPADGNEGGEIIIDAASGTAVITNTGQSTTVAYDVSAASLQTALQGLSSIGSGNLSVWQIYRKHVYYITFRDDIGFGSDLFFDTSALAPGNVDFDCVRVNKNTFMMWHTGTGGTIKLGLNGRGNSASIAFNVAAAAMLTALQTAFGSTAVVAVTRHLRTVYSYNYTGSRGGSAQAVFTVDPAGLGGSTFRAVEGFSHRANPGGAGFQAFATKDLVGSGVGDTMVHETISLAAGTRDFNLESCIAIPGGPAIVGPFFHFGQMFEQPTVRNGYCLMVNIFKGGRPIRVQLESLAQFSDEWSLFRYGAPYGVAVANSADGQCDVLFWISGLVNDRNDTALSVGPSPAPSNTRAGVRDNVAAMYARINAHADVAGIPVKNRYFLYMGSLPVEADDSSLADLRLGVEDFAATVPRFSVIRTQNLVRDFNETRMGFVVGADPFNASPNDPNHHKQRWYAKVAGRAIQAMISYATANGGSGVTLGRPGRFPRFPRDARHLG